MKMNMGTPGSPEDIPHWSTKELIGKKITSAIHSTVATYYMAPSNKLRMVFSTVVPSQALQWSDTWPYWYVWFNEQPHDACEGGLTVVDVARAAGKNGEVRVESDWLAFRPDIGIYREGEFNPACVLEVVDTSSPSPRKLRAFETKGVEAYKVNVKSMRGNLRTTIQYNPLFVAPLANSTCGQAQRAIVNRMLVYWTHLFDQGFLSWIGCCFYPTGTKAYMYGGVRDEDGDSWSWGDPDIKGVQMDSCDWGGPMQITSAGPRKTLSKTQWLDAITHLRVLCVLGIGGRNEMMMAIGKYGDEVMSYAYP